MQTLFITNFSKAKTSKNVSVCCICDICDICDKTTVFGCPKFHTFSMCPSQRHKDTKMHLKGKSNSIAMEQIQVLVLWLCYWKQMCFFVNLKLQNIYQNN